MKKTNNKIMKIDSLRNIVSKNKKNTFGLCHGGFDLLHPGHVKHFESASKLCDKLIVSITCDKFVKERKGANRPIFPENERAYMIASIEFVDFVVISPYKTGIEIIEYIRPDYYIKGPDYKNKNTKGIIQEREAIKKIGGEILYTNDEKFSTSGLIDKIKKIERESFLLILDRDGTIIEEKDFLGKNNSWKDNIILNRPVIDFIHFLLQHYNLTIIVVSNQSGVAWQYFNEERIIEINNIIEKELEKEGIKIDDWQFSPQVDEKYAKIKGFEKFDSKYVKNKSTRKPNTIMIETALNELKSNRFQFERILILGDSLDDKLLAENFKCDFINVKNKKYSEIKKEFTDFL